MKHLKDWSCDFKLDASTAITVGQKFAILCTGDSPLDAIAKPELTYKSEDDSFKLVVLRHKLKSPNELFVSLTSWQTGSHNLGQLKMSVGSEYILLQPPSFKVNSILEKNKEQMNLPPAPIIKSLPDYLWIFLVILLIGAGLYFFKIYKKSRRIDRGHLRLNTFKTTLSPFYEYQKQIRASKKTIEKPVPAAELKELCTQFYKSTVIYLSLQIGSPLFVMSEPETKSLLQKRIKDPKIIKEYNYITRELRKTALEINDKADTKTLQADFENLLDESNDFSQKLNKYFIGVARV